MTREFERAPGKASAVSPAPVIARPAPGKTTLVQLQAAAERAGADAASPERLSRQVRGDGGMGPDAEGAVDRAASSSGAPLRADLRDRFEGALGADLSAVRVHTGADSAQAVGALGANAYAVGNDIHFGAGKYQPDDPFGVHLLAHEVAHTQQQSAGAPHRQHQLEVSQPGDLAEAEADRVADTLVAGTPVSVGGGAAPRIARELSGDKADLAVTSVSAQPNRVALGRDPLHVKVQVENKGAGTGGKAAVDVLFRDTTGKVIKGHETDPMSEIWWKAVSGLAPGAKKEAAFDQVTPQGVPMGATTIGATWFGSNMNDSDPSNNTAWGPQITIADFNGNGSPDPALGYTPEAKAAMKQIDNDKLPYEGKESWKSSEILAKWGQVDNDTKTDTDELRCGPTVALAGFIIGGPAVVYGSMHWLNSKSAEKIQAIQDKGTADQKKQIPELQAARTTLNALFPEFLPSAQAATYGSLSRLAHLMKVLGTSSKDEVASGADMNNFTALGRATHEMNQMVRSKDELTGLIGSLEKNSRYSLTCDTDFRPGERKAGLQMKDMNHWIMIAMMGSQARVILYDPYPHKGKQYIYMDQDADAFWEYFQNDDNGQKVWRGCWIANKSGDVTPFKIGGLTDGA